MVYRGTDLGSKKNRSKIFEFFFFRKFISIPYFWYDELIRLVKLYQIVLRENRTQINMIAPFYQLLSIFSIRNPRPMLDLLEPLLSDLFRILSPTAVNQSDIFRCWGCLITVFSNQVLEFIIRRLDQLPGTSVVRVKSLRVLQYLINYETVHIEDNKVIVLRALLPLQVWKMELRKYFGGKSSRPYLSFRLRRMFKSDCIYYTWPKPF